MLPRVPWERGQGHAQGGAQHRTRKRDSDSDRDVEAGTGRDRRSRRRAGDGRFVATISTSSGASGVASPPVAPRSASCSASACHAPSVARVDCGAISGLPTTSPPQSGVTASARHTPSVASVDCGAISGLPTPSLPQSGVTSVDRLVLSGSPATPLSQSGVSGNLRSISELTAPSLSLGAPSRISLWPGASRVGDEGRKRHTVPPLLELESRRHMCSPLLRSKPRQRWSWNRPLPFGLELRIRVCPPLSRRMA